MRQLGDVKPGEKIIVQVDAELEDIIPAFLEEMHENVRAMQEALKKCDYETLQHLGHKTKGTAGYYGFDAICNIGTSLDQAAKTRDSEEVRNLVDQLSTYLKRVDVRYE